MQKTGMDKVNSMQEQMGNASRDMEILRNQKNARDKKQKDCPYQSY